MEKFSNKEREEFINRIEENDRIFQQDNNWESYLVSDYWRNWKEKTRTIQSDEEAKFFAVKLSKLRSDIIWNTNYYKDDNQIKKLVEIKEEELQNITKKEWEFVKKINDNLDKFFRGGWGIAGYKGWSKEKLIEEIQVLKVEIERLKTLEVNGDYEKVKIKEFSQKLERQLQNSQISLEMIIRKNTNNNNFPFLSIISVIGVVSLLGLIKRKNQRKFS